MTTEEWREEKKRKKMLFTAQQNQPYEVKVRRAELRAIEFVEKLYDLDMEAHVSVGGLDSITLLVFLRKIGYENENEGVDYKTAPFKVSNKCCQYLKEEPCDKWAKEHHSAPFLGLMASEGGQREEALVDHGCNYFGKTVIRSAPFAPFLRQDLLQLALDLNVPVPEIYGKIERKPDGTLYTTEAQRTGCSMCGFGIHMEKRPHRFDKLRERNEKEWEFWMYKCCTDSETGEKYGWGKVLDYIGVEWEDRYVDWEKRQMSIEDYLGNI